MSATEPLLSSQNTGIGTDKDGGSNKDEIMNNLLAYISFLAPVIVTFGVLFFEVMAGASGQGCFYIMWLIVATMIRTIIIFMKKYHESTNNKQNSSSLSSLFVVDKEGVCNKGNFLPGSNSTYSLFVLCFTFVYFLYPMILYNNINFSVIIFFSIYIVFDILVKLYYKCITRSNPIGAIGDFFGGCVLGIVSVVIMINTNKNFLFINQVSSNKEICSMPSAQTFKCSVYKNGQLISSSNIKDQN